MMPKRNNSLARVVIIITGCIFAALVSPSARSQAKGSVAGTILNGVEKPWLGLDLTFYDDKMRFEASATTTVDGKYRVDLPVGTHVLVASVVSHGDHEEFKLVFVVLPNTQTPGDVNFKTFRSSYPALQEHLVNGDRDLSQLKKSREQMTKLQAEIDQAGDRAIGELRKALSTTDEEDSFFQRSGILRKIGDTYDAMGEYAAAARAYQQALALRPDATAFADLSNDLAKSGKFEEAAEACKKSVQLDQSRAAKVYLDLAINLYNAQRFTDAIAPARSVTEIDSNSAKAWYVLAAALAASIEFRDEDNKVVPTVPPGTISCLSESNCARSKGRVGKIGREALDQLQQIQSGIETTRPPRPIH